MNEILKVITERRAVRSYKSKAVSRNLIEQIIEAGRMAPSAINKQPWKFYIITEKAKIKSYSKEIIKVGLKNIVSIGLKAFAKAVVTGISGLAHGIDFLKAKDPVFHGAPVVIFLAASRTNEWAQLDIGMCAQNMMLAAKSLGLDSCPIGFGKFIEKTKYIADLGLNKDDQILLALIIGYGNENPIAQVRNRRNAFFK